MFSRVYEHVSTIRKLYKLPIHVPDVFSSVRTRRNHSQNEKIRSAQMCFYFHERRNALLPFAKTLAYLQIAQKMVPTVSTSAWTRLYHSQNNRVRTGRVDMVSDVTTGIRTPIYNL